jgi:hypothetical protein
MSCGNWSEKWDMRLCVRNTVTKSCAKSQNYVQSHAWGTPFRWDNLCRWLCWGSVRGLICLVGMNVTLAHISLPFCLIRTLSTHRFNSKQTQRTWVVGSTVAWYVDWFVLFCWHKCHACSHHVLAILFHQILINWRVQFWANSENLCCWLSCHLVHGLVCLVGMWTDSNQLTGSIPSEVGELTSLTLLNFRTWIGFVLLAWMSCFLTFACHYIWTGSNQLKASIPSKLGELTLLAELSLGTYIGLSCWHECHACSHFLAILFHQIKMIWLATPTRSFVENFLMNYFCIILIAFLKLCAAAANYANADTRDLHIFRYDGQTTKRDL